MIEGILWVLFILVCILVSVVILLQDPKGGGLGEAFGGVGQQAFGVDNKGIHKFTAYLAVAVVLIAITITKIRSTDTVLVNQLQDPATPVEVPVDPGAAGGDAPGHEGHDHGPGDGN
jgi:preprotein translocase subunit SecG